MEERVRALEVQLLKEQLARRFNRRLGGAVAAMLLALFGYTTFVQVPAAASKALDNEVGRQVLKEIQDAHECAMRLRDLKPMISFDGGSVVVHGDLRAESIVALERLENRGKETRLSGGNRLNQHVVFGPSVSASDPRPRLVLGQEMLSLGNSGKRMDLIVTGKIR